MLSSGDEELKKTKERRRPPHLKEKDRSISPKTNMASTFGTGIKIRKFDGKNFALWKEMMQEVLIILSDDHRNKRKKIHKLKPTRMN